MLGRVGVRRWQRDHVGWAVQVAVAGQREGVQGLPVALVPGVLVVLVVPVVPGRGAAGQALVHFLCDTKCVSTVR